MNKIIRWERWTGGTGRLLAVVIAILMTGCMTTSFHGTPSHVTATPTAFSWETLEQRPVHLPSVKPGTPCPTTHGSLVIPQFDPLLGKGPAYADFFGGRSPTEATAQGILYYATSFGDGSQWGGEKVLWFINPAYRGPILIRGGQLDGVHAVRFNGGPDHEGDPALLTELRLVGGGDGKPWPNWGTYTRLQAPGCYAYRVDGTTFSYLIIFKAVAVHNPPPKP